MQLLYLWVDAMRSRHITQYLPLVCTDSPIRCTVKHLTFLSTLFLHQFAGDCSYEGSPLDSVSQEYMTISMQKCLLNIAFILSFPMYLAHNMRKCLLTKKWSNFSNKPASKHSTGLPQNSCDKIQWLFHDFSMTVSQNSIHNTVHF